MAARSRSLRGLARVGVPLIGVAAILACAFVAEDAITRAALGVTGAAITLISSFALHERLFPNERELMALRAEVNAFIVAVRRTNGTAIAAAQGRGEVATFHAACDDLGERARRIGTVVAATHGLPPARQYERGGGGVGADGVANPR